jgi:hypothetical protein
MSHRDFLDSTTGKITAVGVSAAFLVAAGFLALNFSQGSVVGEDHTPRFSDCTYVEETGNIQGDCEQNRGEISSFGGWGGDVSGAYQDGEPVPKYFWIRIDSIQTFPADGGDEAKSPQMMWLYKNGYVTESGQEDDFPDDVDIAYGDLKWNSELRSSLEAGTVCEATIRPSAQGEVYITTTEEEQAFNDEPDADELHVSEMISSPATVAADDVHITEGYIACLFDFTEVMNKALAMDGYFKSWSGRSIMIGGYDYDEGSTSFDVDFGMDSDGDGFLDENDECPEQPGLEEKDGCPNQPSEIVEINGPRNATLESEVEYSVEVSNPDDDPTTISWGNGDTGETATYTWNSTGTKEITVSADDGFNTSSRSISVQVGEAPEPPSPLEALSSFFSGLLDILWYSG